jgi:tetratricopeptide (TPR) repeat protein
MATRTADKVRRSRDIRDLLTKAGDASIAYSRALTLIDDKSYGEALWKGIDLYDRAANLASVTSALELFVAERPDDSLAPTALLKLGQAYQAMGLFDKAIAAFQRNQFRYPNSLAASKSAVPLAQAYIAKGPEAYSQGRECAEKRGREQPRADSRSRGIQAGTV